MKELNKALILSPIIYIARDAERGLGLAKTTGYWIITNNSPAAQIAKKNYLNIIVIKNKRTLDTHELLTHPKTKHFLKKFSRPNILVFKNTKQIEKVCSENGWRLLNPSAELSNRVEQKLTQLEWLGPLKKFLPPHQVMKCGELEWPLVCHSERSEESLLPVTQPTKVKRSFAKSQDDNVVRWKKYIVQFNHAHTGGGTILIESQKQIDELKNKFPNREVRVTEFIKGPVFTNNNVVWGKKILCGNISYQITGLKPFTDRPFATVGNDWTLLHKILDAKEIKQFKHIATNVGKRLKKDGWKGLFGIDVIMDEKTKKLYLLEINARQPASTTFESQLQQAVILSGAKNPLKQTGTSMSNVKGSFANAQDDKWVTTFEAHLAALIGLQATGYRLQTITDGAQAVQRVGERNKEQRIKSKLIAKLKRARFIVIEYNNTKPGEDLLRVQSARGIMKDHNEFNDIGQIIIEALKN